MTCGGTVAEERTSEGGTPRGLGKRTKVSRPCLTGRRGQVTRWITSQRKRAQAKQKLRGGAKKRSEGAQRGDGDRSENAATMRASTALRYSGLGEKY